MLKTLYYFLLTVIFICISLVGKSQRANADDANEHFKFQNYIDALVVYKKLIEKEPKNYDYYYKAGYCILHINRDKKAAIPFLEKAAENNAHEDAYFYLGLAYHYNLDFDQAIENFKKYKANGKGEKQNLIDRQIEMVENARKQTKSPIDVEYENAGDNINTQYPDYYPFVTPNESAIVFTSRRKGVVGNSREFDGYYSSDIFMSKVVNGEFTPAKGLGLLVNSSYDEQVVGLSYDATILYVYADNIKDYGDIYESKYSKNKFRKRVLMGENVNSKEFESSATISADGNTLFFASNRDGGKGGKDIYMTRKLPTGDWALPQNLGDVINTPYDEDFPNLFYDGSTLYFSSKGHNSIGGYDYFKSNWDAESNTWSKPENIGYPINTPEDNICISFTEDKRHAYISTWREDSKGDLDIYKVTFNELDARQTIFKSKVMKDSTNYITDAFISVVDNRTQEEVGQYMPNSKNGKFVMILKPGSYNVLVDAPGFSPLSEDIVVKGKSDFVPFLDKNFYIKP